MTHADVQGWLDRYIAAWRSNEREPIEALFTEDAIYRYNPYGGEDHTLRGHAAIVAGWLDEGDAPDSWEAHYQPYAVEVEHAVATGWSRYAAGAAASARTFHNVFLLRFEDGRCSEFTELFMEERAT